MYKIGYFLCISFLIINTINAADEANDETVVRKKIFSKKISTAKTDEKGVGALYPSDETTPSSEEYDPSQVILTLDQAAACIYKLRKQEIQDRITQLEQCRVTNENRSRAKEPFLPHHSNEQGERMINAQKKWQLMREMQQELSLIRSRKKRSWTR